MKLAQTFLPLLVCLGLFTNASASEIRLEGEKEFFLKGDFDDESAPVKLIRTSKTSGKIRIYVDYSFTHRWVDVIKKCARTDTRKVTGQSETYCGKDLIRIDTYCGTRQNCTTSWDPCKWSIGGDCKPGDGGNVESCTSEPYCESTPIFNIRTCEYVETFCAEWAPDENVPKESKDSLLYVTEISFKNLDKVAKGSEQTFSMKMGNYPLVTQDGTDKVLQANFLHYYPKRKDGVNYKRIRYCHQKDGKYCY